MTARTLRHTHSSHLSLILPLSARVCLFFKIMIENIGMKANAVALLDNLLYSLKY